MNKPVNSPFLKELRHEKEIRATEKTQVPCEQYTRVVGYYRPVNQWNKGKQSEYQDRVTYSLDKALSH